MSLGTGIGVLIGGIIVIGCFIVLFVFIPIALCDSEIWHAIDHRLAEKIKGDKTDIDIDVR